MDAGAASTTKIIIADDHEMFADGLEKIINSTPGFEVIAKVTNANLLMQKLNGLQRDIVLLDISMPPYMDGMDAAKIIKDKYKEIKIILISANYDLFIKRFLSEYHIDGFVIKNAGAQVFTNALNRVAAGETVIITPTGQPKPLRTGPANDVLKKYKLTATESDIIKLIAAGHSTKAIAAKRGRSMVTIEKQRANIMRKLQVKNMAEIATFAVKHGLM